MTAQVAEAAQVSHAPIETAQLSDAFGAVGFSAVGLSIDTLLGPRDLARQLNAVFGAPVTGKLAGYQDPKIGYRWARADGPKPAREALRRLYASSRIWSQVTRDRSYTQATAWFQAPHPELDGEQPVELMIQGRFGEVSAVTQYQDESPAQQLKRATSDVIAMTDLWHEASLAPLLEVIKFLAERFGAPSVALLAGEANPKAVYRWVKNEGRLPSGGAAMSIYGVYRAVLALDAIFPAPSVQAWFVAANRVLGERSPLDVARNGDPQAFIDAANRLLFPLNQVRNNR